MPRYVNSTCPIERVIAEVRKHSILYDRAHPEYKNLQKKAETWKEVANKFNQEPQVIKMKWRNCRDSYLKAKRAIKGAKTVHTYKEWPWTKNMRFMDRVLEARPPKPNDATPGDSRPAQRRLPAAPFPPESTSSDSESPSQDDSENKILTSPTSTQNIRKNGRCNHCVVNYLENKQNSEKNQDEIEHLFHSYAKTFKRFSVRSQAKLKVQLAQLFAETELAEFDEQHPTQSSSSLLVGNSAHNDVLEPSPVCEVKCISMAEF